MTIKYSVMITRFRTVHKRNCNFKMSEFYISNPLKNEGYPQKCYGQEIFQCMQRNGNKIAQIDDATGHKDTYASLLKRCIRTALKIQSLGVTRNDIILICTYNHLNSCVPYFATVFLGMKVASLDPSLSVTDTAHLLKQIEPAMIFLIPDAIELITKSLEMENLNSKLVIFDTEPRNGVTLGDFAKFSDYLALENLAEEEAFEPVQIDIKESVIMLFSSGTTGLPKAVCLNSYVLLNQARNIVNYELSLPISLTYTSLYWISSVMIVSGSIMGAYTWIVSKKFDAQAVWRTISKYRVEFLFLAPYLATEMLKVDKPHNLDISSLRKVSTGGSHIPSTLLNDLRAALPNTFISIAYGQTEIAGYLSCSPPDIYKHNPEEVIAKAASGGHLIQGFTAKVVDPETDQVLGPNQRGELRLKTNFIMNGYYNQDSSEAYDKDGWLRTGDIVYFDRDQYIFIVDRIKDMLKFRSWHVSPAMLEQVLLKHPAVKKACVIGLPHKEDGDHPMALIILNPEYKSAINEMDLLEFCNKQVSERQQLRGGVRFVQSFVTTPTGKVRREVMKRMVLEHRI